MRKYREWKDRDQVALLAEGVDRNGENDTDYWAEDSRPPRGGRG